MKIKKYMQHSLYSCLGLTSIDPAPLLPPHVESTLFQRIEQQIQNYQPTLQVIRENQDQNHQNCAHQGQYSVAFDRVYIQAENEIWQGSLTASHSDILEGKKIALEHILQTSANFYQLTSSSADSGTLYQNKVNSSQHSSQNSSKQWIFWSAITGVSLFFLYRYQQDRKAAQAWIDHAKK